MNERTILHTRPVEAIVFDLDDTLVDTYGILIGPLESEAAAAMLAAESLDADSERLTELILRLRREAPERVEELLSQNIQGLGEKALEARRAVFARASPDKLRMEPAVREMLHELYGRYDTYLLTTGVPDFQSRKLDGLRIRSLFKAVAILASEREETKQSWLSSLADSGYGPQSVMVVGNRLDNEIRAGSRLGMKTVWVKYGEGSNLKPSTETGEPDYVIEEITELPKVLAKIESPRTA